MELKIFIGKLEAFTRKFEDLMLRQVNEKFGKDLSADIAMRVREGGYNADGERFSPYSKFTLAKKAAKGKSILYKNFEDTGDMWRGFDSLGTQKTTKGFTVRLGGKNNYSATLITKNSVREGQSIIKPSEGEIKFAEEALQKRFQKELHNLFTNG